MKLGAYTACLHDRSLPETLKILRELGLSGAEINAGGFVPAPHLPIEQIQASAAAREEYLGLFEQAGIALTGLNVNGNPLNPDPEVGPRHADDLRQAITLASLLGGRNTLNRWPEDSSWQFVAVGRGHDLDFWARFLRALHAVDPDMAVNIEHEDTELDQIEGLRLAAENLTAAAAAAGVAGT
jgi:sugar phosphate isomerase/epimerase